MPVLAAFFSGLLFAVGLAIGGMTDPLKVVSFLDVTGGWDPSLAFVMGGAIAVYAPIYHFVTRRRQPLWHHAFVLPTRKDIDAQLLAGAVMFGLGWGLGGFCPGPAVVSAASLHSDALTFVAAMFAGMVIVYVARRVRGTQGSP